jgi:hypothetical protein
VGNLGASGINADEDVHPVVAVPQRPDLHLEQVPWLAGGVEYLFSDKSFQHLSLVALYGVAWHNWLRNRLPCAPPRLGSSVFCAHCGPPLRIWLDRPTPRGEQQHGTEHTRDGQAGILTQDEYGDKQKKRKETSRMDPREFNLHSEVARDYPSKSERVAVVILHGDRRRGSSWRADDCRPQQPSRRSFRKGARRECVAAIE